MLILLSSLFISSVYCDSWIAAKQNEMIPFEWDKTPIEIKTTQAKDSDKSISLKFFMADKKTTAAGVAVKLASTIPTYTLAGCSGNVQSPNPIPDAIAGELVWKFTKTQLPSKDPNGKPNDPKVVIVTIECNGKEIVTVRLSDTVCTQFPNGQWRVNWNVDVGNVFFDPNVDSASEFYRAVTEVECSAGSYNKDGECKQCEKNTFSADGADSCTKCPDGEQSAAGSKSKDDCQKYQAPSDAEASKMSALLLSFLLAVCVV